MVATNEILEDIADALRIDYLDDEEKKKVMSRLSRCVAGAESWLSNTGVTVDYEDSRVFDAVTMYAGRRYDDPANTETYGTGSMALDALAEQIRISQKASDSDA